MAVFTSRAAAGPNLSLAARAAELREARGALDAFGDAGSEVRSSFSLSYDALGADAARLFRLIGRAQSVDLTPGTAPAMAASISLDNCVLAVWTVMDRPVLAKLAIYWKPSKIKHAVAYWPVGR